MDLSEIPLLVTAAIALLVFLGAAGLIWLLHQRSPVSAPIPARDEVDLLPAEDDPAAEAALATLSDAPPADRDGGGEESPALLELEIGNLKNLSVTGPWQVFLQFSASENSCRIGYEPEEARHIKIEGPRKGLLVRYHGRKAPSSPLTIDITLKKTPEQVKLTGKCRCWIDNAAGTSFTCKLSDGSIAELTDVTSEELQLKLCGQSRITGTGQCRKADLEVSDHSRIELSGAFKELKTRISGGSKAKIARADRAEVEISGSSKLKLETDGAVEGDVSGSSQLKLIGQANAKGVRVSGASRVKTVKPEES